MVEVTEFINNSAVKNAAAETAKSYGEEAIKKVIFFSGVFVRWIVDTIGKTGLEIPAMSITALMVLICVLLIWVVVKFVDKVALKVIFVLALLWFIAGFFVVPE